MTSAAFRKSSDSERSDKKSTFSKQSRIKCWEHNPPHAIGYHPKSSHLAAEDINEVNSKLPNMLFAPCFTVFVSRLILSTEESNCFEIQLPRWNNLVLVYSDMEDPSGLYPTALRLDRLGMKKNWQRRLGMNYKVLHVKGKKPVWPI